MKTLAFFQASYTTHFSSITQMWEIHLPLSLTLPHRVYIHTCLGTLAHISLFAPHHHAMPTYVTAATHDFYCAATHVVEGNTSFLDEGTPYVLLISVL